MSVLLALVPLVPVPVRGASGFGSRLCCLLRILVFVVLRGACAYAVTAVCSAHSDQLAQLQLAG